MKRQLLLFLFVVALAACHGINVSSKIPEGYVPTPHGLVHRSCVQQVPVGHRVEEDGTITSPGGTRERSALCRYPRLDPRTYERISVDPPQVNDWVVSVGWTSDVPVGYLSANYIVPPAPTDNGALIYFFPGMTSSPEMGIIQPVLQYGAGPAGGGNYWTVASWYCCPAGMSNYSPLVNVNPGDTIAGSMKVSCETGNCAGLIVTEDVTTSVATVLPFSRTMPPFTKTAGGALEVYSVNECDQFPASGTIEFTNITMTDQSGNPLQPVWKVNVRKQEPDCGYSATTSSTTATLNY